MLPNASDKGRVSRPPSWSTRVHRLAGIPAGKLLLSVAGLSAFPIGILVAWHAEAATPILVTAAVLAVLGLLPIRTAEASHGGTTVRAHLDAAGESLVEVAQRPELPDDVREEIVEAAEHLEAAAEAAGEAKPPPRPPRPYHRRLGGGEVLLGLAGSGGLFNRYLCTVTDPENAQTSAYARQKGRGVLAFVGPSVIIYPDEFEEARRELIPGTYDVDWHAQSMFGLTSLLGDTLVARDRFTID